MNSTLQVCGLFFITFAYLNTELSQALASLTYLQPHIDAIHAKAEALEVPTLVIDAELFKGMPLLILCVSPFNTAAPHRSQHSQIFLSFPSTA